MIVFYRNFNGILRQGCVKQSVVIYKVLKMSTMV
jgi:hypothetical protein